MRVAARITDIKRVRGQTFLTVGCCSNQLGFLCECKDIPVTTLRTGSGTRQSVENGVIVGNTCLEFDCIRKGASGEFAIGDTLLFGNVGAYSVSASRQFIIPRLGAYDAESLECLREPETAEDMFKKYLDSSSSIA